MAHETPGEVADVPAQAHMVFAGEVGEWYCGTCTVDRMRGKTDFVGKWQPVEPSYEFVVAHVALAEFHDGIVPVDAFYAAFPFGTGCRLVRTVQEVYLYVGCEMCHGMRCLVDRTQIVDPLRLGDREKLELIVNDFGVFEQFNIIRADDEQSDKRAMKRQLIELAHASAPAVVADDRHVAVAETYASPQVAYGAC